MAQSKALLKNTVFPYMIEVDLNHLLYSHLYPQLREDLTKLSQSSHDPRGSMAEMNKLDPLRASRGGEIAVDEMFEEEYY